MKVCVINFSGNVGKTTVAANLLTPRMGAMLFSVETLNQDAGGDGMQVQRVRAQRFDDLQRQLLETDSAVVDVGASNVELFMEMMIQFRQSQLDYDYFVVPTVKERKQITDTINTIEALRDLGVEEERIKIVFNKVDPKDVLAEEFEGLFGLAALGRVQLNEKAVLYRNPVFEMIKDYDMSLDQVIADPIDHRIELRSETTPEGKTMRIHRLAIQRAASSCALNMDAAYTALFAQ